MIPQKISILLVVPRVNYFFSTGLMQITLFSGWHKEPLEKFISVFYFQALKIELLEISSTTHFSLHAILKVIRKRQSKSSKQTIRFLGRISVWQLKGDSSSNVSKFSLSSCFSLFSEILLWYWFEKCKVRETILIHKHNIRVTQKKKIGKWKNYVLPYFRIKQSLIYKKKSSNGGNSQTAQLSPSWFDSENKNSW